MGCPDPLTPPHPVAQPLPYHPFMLHSLCLFGCVTVTSVHSVVGPALTFRVRPNSQNLTAAEVADKAGKCVWEALVLFRHSLMMQSLH